MHFMYSLILLSDTACTSLLRTIRYIAFTLLIKIGVLVLTLFGLTNMWMGVFADVGVTLIAICNSMRILYKKS